MLHVVLITIVLLISGHAHAQNTLTYPPGTVDDIIIIEGANQLMNGARADNVRPSADGKSIELVDGAIAGSLTLPVIPGRFPFNEAIPSWNGWAPKETGFRIWMNPILVNRVPQPWFDAGTWGRLADELTTRVIHLNAGIYNIDTLQLNTLAQGVAIRIDLVRPSPGHQSPQIYMFALSYSNTTGDRRLTAQYAPSPRRLARSTQLQVPYYSQVVSRDNWIGRICSPASVNMALAQFGVKRDTLNIASNLYDPVSDAFGVWHRSVQGASQEGVRGYITRMRNWNDVAAELEKGHVVCASIRFKAGEVDDPMLKVGRRKRGTEGHLVLITGVRTDGTVTVHDTASKDHGVHSVWKQEDLAKAWFEKGGVTYIFTGPRQ